MNFYEADTALVEWFREARARGERAGVLVRPAGHDRARADHRGHCVPAADSTPRSEARPAPWSGLLVVLLRVVRVIRLRRVAIR